MTGRVVGEGWDPTRNAEGSHAKRVVARKQHHCFNSGCEPIHPGDAYLQHTAFPGSDDAGYATAAGHPIRLAECMFCAARYGRDYLLGSMPASQEARYVEGIYQRWLA